jgi:Reverse transcriptase (RNA-dependent DNA polymerase)
VHGIVQGSVIGPLLFVLFINDITHLFMNNNCTCNRLYADDLKLYTVLHTDIDGAILQYKLNAIGDWSRQW